MRARPTRAAAVLALTVVVAACAGARTEGPSASVRDAAPGHAAVDTGLETCAGCHAEATPSAAAQWQASKHGVALVQCFTCHGSTGEDFTARPAARSCGACHVAEASTIALGRCFECHPPHALRPDTRYGSPHGPPER